MTARAMFSDFQDLDLAFDRARIDRHIAEDRLLPKQLHLLGVDEHGVVAVKLGGVVKM